VKFKGYADEETIELCVPIGVPTSIKSLIKPVVARSEGVTFTLSEEAWGTVCAYLTMVDQNLTELQDVIAKPKMAMTEIVMGVETSWVLSWLSWGPGLSYHEALWKYVE
jgi:hypothetical protein